MVHLSFKALKATQNLFTIQELTEVVGDHQETLERLLRLPDEVDEVLQYPHQQGSTGRHLQVEVG